jgi:two-component system phosphate regulon sensor histidine kinase PhoR
MNEQGVQRRNRSSIYGQNLSFFKFAIESIPVGVLSVDSSLRITGFNPWAEKITGYSEKDALQHFCGDILQGGMCNINCPLRTVLRREKPMIEIETTIQKKSGESVPVRMNTAGLFDSRGDLIGGIEAFQDISRVKHLERERGNIVSMIAHDMKSPIISIHGFAHRLEKRIAGEKEREYLHIIEKEATRLEALITDFLEVSRLQTGKLPLNLSATSLDKELYELCELYQPRARKKGLSLELHSEEPLPIINADSQRLRRVFSNLLDNAIKFSRKKGVVTVSTQLTDGDVIVKVQDQGIGIDPYDLPYIFEPFHRGRGKGEKEDGFGLGLAGVKAIVEGHGGSVHVHSELGKGSAFFVVLPKSLQELKVEDETME